MLMKFFYTLTILGMPLHSVENQKFETINACINRGQQYIRLYKYNEKARDGIGFHCSRKSESRETNYKPKNLLNPVIGD